MAIALPTKFKQGPASSATPVDNGGRLMSRATSGVPRIAITHGDIRYDIMLTFPINSAAEKDELDTFYRNNAANEIEFTFIKDGFNYTGYFIDLPEMNARLGPDAFGVAFHLTCKRVI